MADEVNHTDKTKFAVPFVCGCRNLGEALRRVAEGAAFLRTKVREAQKDSEEATVPLCHCATVPL